jgi:hypothetical protein
VFNIHKQLTAHIKDVGRFQSGKTAGEERSALPRLSFRPSLDLTGRRIGLWLSEVSRADL